MAGGDDAEPSSQGRLYRKRKDIADDDMQTYASSAKLVDPSVLTSTMAEAKMVPPEPALLSMLNVVSVVDVSSLFALLVVSTKSYRQP